MDKQQALMLGILLGTLIALPISYALMMLADYIVDRWLDPTKRHESH